jgi:hypothetical protein
LKLTGNGKRMIYGIVVRHGVNKFQMPSAAQC